MPIYLVQGFNNGFQNPHLCQLDNRTSDYKVLEVEPEEIKSSNAFYQTLTIYKVVKTLNPEEYQRLIASVPLTPEEVRRWYQSEDLFTHWRLTNLVKSLRTSTKLTDVVLEFDYNIVALVDFYDQDVWADAINFNHELVGYCPEEFWDDRKFMLKLVDICGDDIDILIVNNMPDGVWDRWSTNEEFVAEAIKINSVVENLVN